MSHFWTMVVTMGPCPLRVVSLAGVIAGLAGLGLAVTVIVEKVAGNVNVPGWTSLTVVVLLLGGLNLWPSAS